MACYENYIPIEMDVLPMDNSGTKKEGVSLTYKKSEGYSPLRVYIEQEGNWLNMYFRLSSCYSQFKIDGCVSVEHDRELA